MSEEYPYQEVQPMGGTDGDPEPTTIHGSISPRWLEAQEKEQGGKLEILRGVIKIKRDEAFVESSFGSREKKMMMQAMVNAYDVVLNLIEKALGSKGKVAAPEHLKLEGPGPWGK